MKSYIRKTSLVTIVAFLGGLIIYMMFLLKLFHPTLWLPFVIAMGSFLILFAMLISLGLFHPRYSRQAYQKYGGFVIFSAAASIIFSLLLLLINSLNMFLYSLIASLLFFFFLFMMGHILLFVYELHYRSYLYDYQNASENKKSRLS